MTFVGHEIIVEVIKPGKDKIHIILDYVVLTSIKRSKTSVWLVNFRRRFIPHVAERLVL